MAPHYDNMGGYNQALDNATMAQSQQGRAVEQRGGGSVSCPDSAPPHSELQLRTSRTLFIVQRRWGTEKRGAGVLGSRLCCTGKPVNTKLMTKVDNPPQQREVPPMRWATRLRILARQIPYGAKGVGGGPTRTVMLQAASNIELANAVDAMRWLAERNIKLTQQQKEFLQGGIRSLPVLEAEVREVT